MPLRRSSINRLGGTCHWATMLDSGESDDVFESDTMVITIASSANGVAVGHESRAGLGYTSTFKIAEIFLDPCGVIDGQYVLNNAGDVGGSIDWDTFQNTRNIVDVGTGWLMSANQGSDTHLVQNTYAALGTIAEQHEIDDNLPGKMTVLSTGDIVVNNNGVIDIINMATGSPLEADMQFNGGNDNVYDVIALSGGDFAVVGSFYDGTGDLRASVWIMDSDYSTVNAAKQLYKLNDTLDFGQGIGGCADSSDNIYVAWVDYDSSSSNDPYLFVTKFNSSLVEQWTAEFGTDALYASDINSGGGYSINLSPNEDTVYLMFNNGLSGDGAYLISLDSGTGAKETEHTITGTGSYLIKGMKMDVSANGIAMAGVFNDGTYDNGIAVMQTSLAKLQTRGDYWTVATSTLFSVSDDTGNPTYANITVTPSSNSITVEADSTDMELTAIASAFTNNKVSF